MVLLRSLAGLLTLGAATAQEESCWEAGASFDLCCKMVIDGVQGDTRCWGEGFTYDRCCVHELSERVKTNLVLIEDGKYREASHAFFDLHFNYATKLSGNEPAFLESWYGFEKATKEFQKALDRLPEVLSYADVLFDGLREQCDEAPTGGPRDVFADFERCCRKHVFMRPGCLTLLEMISMGLAERMRRDPGGEDAYYAEFSQHWAFHHFTPSLLTGGGGVEGDDEKAYHVAFDINWNLADAFVRDETEPKLGVVWAEHATGRYVSPKFYYGVFYLTLALDAARRASPARPVEIFEIGAGYGSLPRLSASARHRLLHLPGGPLDIQSYTIMDLRSVNDLQRWYLSKTLGVEAEIREDWAVRGPATLAEGFPAPLFAERSAEAPLRIDLVERDARDAFAHLYRRERDPAMSSAAADLHSAGRTPVRVLVAVNSWHEMAMPEFLWYFNSFVTGPAAALAADWILYVSNPQWQGNDAKVRMLLDPSHGLILDYERHTATNSYRLFRRSRAG